MTLLQATQVADSVPLINDYDYILAYDYIFSI